MRLAGNRAEVGRNAALNGDSSQSQTMRFTNWEIQLAAGLVDATNIKLAAEASMAGNARNSVRRQATFPSLLSRWEPQSSDFRLPKTTGSC